MRKLRESGLHARDGDGSGTWFRRRSRSLVGVALLMASGCSAAVPPRAGGDPGAATTTSPVTAQDVQDAGRTLRAYEAALNEADVDRIVSLYAPDAVFMAQHRLPAVGSHAIRAAYSEIFDVIRLHVVFDIDEVVMVSSTVAYARTRSAGQTTLLESGEILREGNQELFVLLRDDPESEFRIGRYIFSTTTPPAEPAACAGLKGHEAGS